MEREGEDAMGTRGRNGRARAQWEREGGKVRMRAGTQERGWEARARARWEGEGRRERRRRVA